MAFFLCRHNGTPHKCMPSLPHVRHVCANCGTKQNKQALISYIFPCSPRALPPPNTPHHQATRGEEQNNPPHTAPHLLYLSLFPPRLYPHQATMGEEPFKIQLLRNSNGVLR